MARPSVFDRTVFDLICARMAAGETVREICRNPEMPAESTVRTWAVKDIEPGVAAQYMRAREALVECWADENIEIADDGTNDWVERRKKNGEVEIVLDREHVERSKLRISQRNWMLARIMRRTYGAPAEQAPTGDDSGVTIKGGLPD